MSKKQEALQLLEEFDDFKPVVSPSTKTTGAGPGSAGAAARVPNANTNAGPSDGADALAFIDDITKKSAEPTVAVAVPPLLTASGGIARPSSRSSVTGPGMERVRVGTPTQRKGPDGIKGSASPATLAAPAQGGGGGWGSWGNVWSSASAVIQQARTVVDEQVKNLPANLPNNEQAKKWSEEMTQGVMGYVKQAQLDKLGQEFKTASLSRFTEIMNVVAPPITEHEFIQVWLSHDMDGYEGTENLVFRSLGRTLEQVQASLTVKTAERKNQATGAGRDLNAVEGFDVAFKLAQASLAEVVKVHGEIEQPPPKAAQSQLVTPTIDSHVFLRIQPFFSLSPTPTSTAPPASTAPSSSTPPRKQFQFILHLSDPANSVIHTTVTQALPARWIDMWTEHEWVEDMVVEALRVGVEVVGQEYVVSRMSWGKNAVEEDEEKGKDRSKELEKGPAKGKEKVVESEESTEEEESEEEESEEEEETS